MSLSERVLVARLRRRDELAFNEVVELHGDKVFSLVLRMVGTRAEAEDIAQEVFVTVFKSIDSFRGESKLSTWILRIAANHSKNRIKYLSRRPTESEDVQNAAAAAGAPDALLEAAQTDRLMQDAIAELDEDHRLVVVLRDIEDLSYEEICEITGLPDGTVKSRLHRARMALKDLVEGKLR